MLALLHSIFRRAVLPYYLVDQYSFVKASTAELLSRPLHRFFSFFISFLTYIGDLRRG